MARRHAHIIQRAKGLGKYHGTARVLWRVNREGYIQTLGKHPVFTAFIPLKGLAAEVYDKFGEHIRNASGWFNIPEAVIVATICNESAGNPISYRYESHLGDASLGLGQLLTATAHNLGTHLGWPKEGLLGHAWSLPADTIPDSGDTERWTEFLFNPAVNVALTTAYHYAKSNAWPEWQKDPILLYASYNAGHAYESLINPWGLHATPAAISGFRNFYNDHVRNMK